LKRVTIIPIRYKNSLRKRRRRSAEEEDEEKGGHTLSIMSALRDRGGLRCSALLSSLS